MKSPTASYETVYYRPVQERVVRRAGTYEVMKYLPHSLELNMLPISYLCCRQKRFLIHDLHHGMKNLLFQLIITDTQQCSDSFTAADSVYLQAVSLADSRKSALLLLRS